MALPNNVYGAAQFAQAGVLGMQRIKGNALQATAVTPGDTTDVFFDALYIGVSGDVTVDMVGRPGEAGNTTITFKAVPVGILPISVVRVRATGTLATNILGLNW